MSKRQTWKTVIDEFEQGETVNCPYCAKEGKKERFCCYRHKWCYGKWWKGLRTTFPSNVELDTKK
jgi:hypothetical protein